MPLILNGDDYIGIALKRRFTMKKKILGIVLSIVFALSLMTSAYATEEMTSYAEQLLLIDEQYVAAEIYAIHGIYITPTASYHLIDTAGNPTYTCVEFTYGYGKVGYGIVDLCSYALNMYSLDLKPPFESTDKVIYSGGLDFAVVLDGSDIVRDVLTQKIANISEVQSSERSNYTVIGLEERETCINNVADRISVYSLNADVIVAGGSNTSLVYDSGLNSGRYTTDCGINAAAMYLNHLNIYFGGGYLMSTVAGDEEKLKTSIAAYAVGVSTPTTLLTISQIATLVNGYTLAHGTIHTNVSTSIFSWSKYSNAINGGYGVPCILDIPAGSTTYWGKEHAVVGVGYTSGATASSGSIIVNSGSKSLGYVYIRTSIPSWIIS